MIKPRVLPPQRRQRRFLIGLRHVSPGHPENVNQGSTPPQRGRPALSEAAEQWAVLKPTEVDETAAH
jgi:hypothetical protein